MKTTIKLITALAIFVICLAWTYKSSYEAGFVEGFEYSVNKCLNESLQMQDQNGNSIKIICLVAKEA